MAVGNPAGNKHWKVNDSVTRDDEVFQGKDFEIAQTPKATRNLQFVWNSHHQAPS